MSKIAVMNSDGTITVDSSSGERRQFLTEVLESGEDEHILEQLYKYTANVILLVRTRLEAEKSIEKQLEQIIDVEAVVE